MAKTINSLSYHIQVAIVKNDINSLLVFLFSNAYFKINTNNWQALFDAHKEEVESLTISILNILKKIRFELGLKEGAPYNEKESLEEYKLGVESSNIASIYKFIQAVEYGGIGFHFYSLAKSLLRFLLVIDTKQGVEFINGLQEPKDCVFYLSELNKRELLCISNLNLITNKWVLFELIRQLVEKKNNKNESDFNQDDKNAIEALLTTLHREHKALYNQTIVFMSFQSSILFNASLGRQITVFSKKEIEDFFNLLPINKNNFNIVARTALLNEFSALKGTHKYSYGLSIVNSNWTKLYSEINKSHGLYELFLTDYANFIAEHYCFQDDATICKEALESLSGLIYIDSVWFKNGTDYTTAFHLYLSKLYLLSYAANTKNIVSKEIGELLNILLLDEILMSNYREKKKIDVFTIIKENFEQTLAASDNYY